MNENDLCFCKCFFTVELLDNEETVGYDPGVRLTYHLLTILMFGRIISYRNCYRIQFF